MKAALTAILDKRKKKRADASEMVRRPALVFSGRKNAKREVSACKTEQELSCRIWKTTGVETVPPVRFDWPERAWPEPLQREYCF